MLAVNEKAVSLFAEMSVIGFKQTAQSMQMLLFLNAALLGQILQIAHQQPISQSFLEQMPTEHSILLGIAQQHCHTAD